MKTIPITGGYIALVDDDAADSSAPLSDEEVRQVYAAVAERVRREPLGRRLWFAAVCLFG